MRNNYQLISLFVAGIFFGGAVDHVILALAHSRYTAYGVNSGVFGNWLLAGLDLLITLIFYSFFIRIRKQ
jgi:hypothetical protein